MLKTLVIVDSDEFIQELETINTSHNSQLEFISFESYLNDYPKKGEPKTRIINLCDAEYYLSKGYYCSLLAEAREHTVLPSVRTVNELRDQDIRNVLTAKYCVFDGIPVSEDGYDAFVFFGKCSDTRLQKVASELFKRFPSPIIHLHFKKQAEKTQVRVQRFAFSRLDKTEREQFLESLSVFTQNVWRIGSKIKRQRWDMAILVNPQEPSPPSNKEAIQRFIKAASKLGIHAEAVTHQDIQNINYYDALFIRETTAINHHTYELASKGENQGVVVIDDANSILRCCNKVYLQDAFSYRNVPAPKTMVVSDANESTLQHLEENFSYPMVLKMPEGSFSRGVFKIKNKSELKEQLQNIMKESALVLVQEYLYTEYDWRIGVLNGRAIYASKYLMARNHWQIYNHGAKRFSSGGFETLPTFEVPKSVLDAALKASSIIGNSLYGVDVKHIDGKAYVLEVNDNPSIEHKVEDAYLGDELYMLIMAEFQRRLEARGR